MYSIGPKDLMCNSFPSRSQPPKGWRRVSAAVPALVPTLIMSVASVTTLLGNLFSKRCVP